MHIAPDSPRPDPDNLLAKIERQARKTESGRRNWLGMGGEETEFSNRKRRHYGYLMSLFTVFACTLLAWGMSRYFELANIVMVYLLGVVLVAVRYGSGPSVLAAVLGVAAFDFFFVPPYFNFAVSDTQYVVTFGVMLVVGLVISKLAAGMRLQARVASHRERRTAALYAMSRELTAIGGQDNLIAIAVRHIAEVFEAQAAVLLPDVDGKVNIQQDGAGALPNADLGVAQWVYDHGQAAGRDAGALYLPLRTSTEVLGVLAVTPRELRQVMLPEQRCLLETFASQISMALERVRLGRMAREAQVRVETERLRNSLLSAISHDLRTPLAAIVGASSSLLEEDAKLTPEARHNLSRDILEASQRMSELVNNVLEMARLQSGTIQLKLEWYPLEEVVGSVLTRLKERIKEHPVSVELPAEALWLSMDGSLVEQVLVNLVENAVKYTPSGTPMTIGAEPDGDGVIVEVADQGPGLPSGSEQRVFEKFYRAQKEGSQGGVGLGLAICQAIVEAHGGRIWAENRAGGGASFKFRLPSGGTPPEIARERP